MTCSVEAPAPRKCDNWTQRTLSKPAVRGIRKAAYSHLALMPVSEAVQQRLQWRLTRRAQRYETLEVKRLYVEPPQRRCVGIVMATYQRPHLVCEAVASVLSQSVSNYYLVVVGDGPGSVPRFTDPRVLTVTLSGHTGNLGLVRNVGVRLIRDKVDYLAFLDDDNQWHPDHLSIHLAAHAEFGQPALSYSSAVVVDSSGEEVGRIGQPWSRYEMRRRNIVDANTIVVSVRGSGLFSRLYRANLSMRKEDWEFVWRISRRLPVLAVPDATVRYFENPESYLTDRRPR